jgi:uncharacterized membrane protein
VIASALLFVHLVSFAAYLGAGIAQTQLLRRSRAAALSADVVADHERLAASIVTKIELPAIMGSIASGVGFIVQNPAVMKLGWLHGKLACVLVLAVLSHLEMFNARKIVKVRATGGDGAQAAIDAMKKKHATFGAIGAALLLAVMVLVTFVRLG